MAVHIPQWDLRCEKCGDSQKRFNGCEEETEILGCWKIREWEWKRCPLKLITEFTNSAIVVYSNLQKGILPYSEGYNRNSKKFSETMEIIDLEVKRIEAENARQARK